MRASLRLQSVSWMMVQESTQARLLGAVSKGLPERRQQQQLVPEQE